MKQQFLYILIALFTMSINASQKQYSEPDFAFPKQVSSQASEMLERAVAEPLSTTDLHNAPSTTTACLKSCNAYPPWSQRKPTRASRQCLRCLRQGFTTTFIRMTDGNMTVAKSPTLPCPMTTCCGAADSSEPA